MIEQIKKASIFASKDPSSILSNVYVSGNNMQCHDGVVGINMTIDNENDLSFCCNAIKLRTILSNCSDDLKLSIKNGKLSIKSGKFKSTIQVISSDEYPVVTAQSDFNAVDFDIIASVLKASSFTDVNDVRTFCRGVEISDKSVSATNGYVAYKHKVNIPVDKNFIIPSKSIASINSAKIQADGICIVDNFIYMSFQAGYFFSKSIDTKMPNIDKIIAEVKNETFTDTIKDAVSSLSPLCTNHRTILLGDQIRTKDEDASFDGFSITDSAFNVDYLIKIFDVADVVDFSYYPNPCPFEAENITGAICGVKL